ncbi:MAG: hypothetical protein ACP5MI_00110 [Candidatus Kryptoniota bacterium]
MVLLSTGPYTEIWAFLTFELERYNQWLISVGVAPILFTWSPTDLLVLTEIQLMCVFVALPTHGNGLINETYAYWSVIG